MCVGDTIYDWSFYYLYQEYQEYYQHTYFNDYITSFIAAVNIIISKIALILSKNSCAPGLTRKVPPEGVFEDNKNYQNINLKILSLHKKNELKFHQDPRRDLFFLD